MDKITYVYNLKCQPHVERSNTIKFSISEHEQATYIETARDIVITFYWDSNVFFNSNDKKLFLKTIKKYHGKIKNETIDEVKVLKCLPLK